MNEYHISVLLKEMIAALSPRKGGMYIDATLGGGGHTVAIAKMGGLVLGIDQDEDAITYVSKKIKEENENLEGKVTLVRGNFRNIGEIAKSVGFTKVDGILLDVGVSSHQIDTGERGFSFLRDGPLDMRMDTTLAVTAADLIHALSKKELATMFYRLGEERHGNRIAQAIVDSRKDAPIQTTTVLAELIVATVGRYGDVHPATRVFQALRIAVNDELHSLEIGLEQAVDLLKKGGRIAVISFHSLEDRIVKDQFVSFEKKGKGKIITKKPIEPTEEEKEANPRSRSAKLRVFETMI